MAQQKWRTKACSKLSKLGLRGQRGAWLKELQNVLCAYRATTRVPTGETPFRLTFGTEAITPVEVTLTSFWVKTYEDQKHQKELNNNLDLIDEVRVEAMNWMAKHKEAMVRNYNRKVKVRRFNTGDLVLRKVSQATKDPSQGKLGPTWEGLYEVIHHSKEGSYYLKSLDG